MATVGIQIEDWRMLPWKKYQENVYRLQKRIYQAARRGDWECVHSLQRLLLRSWSARCLAVRQVTQDNRGKCTPGVDGVASMTPQERLALAKSLRNLSDWTAQPIRRVYTNGTRSNQAGLDDQDAQATTRTLRTLWTILYDGGRTRGSSS